MASGLVAGALTKDKEDPIYTGQDVGLNLQDIAKLANLSDPKTASAIGLRFSPDVAARKFYASRNGRNICSQCTYGLYRTKTRSRRRRYHR